VIRGPLFSCGPPLMQKAAHAYDQTHINVQVVNSNNIARYMFKYSHKGGEMLEVFLTRHNAASAEQIPTYDWDVISHIRNMRVMTGVRQNFGHPDL